MHTCHSPVGRGQSPRHDRVLSPFFFCFCFVLGGSGERGGRERGGGSRPPREVDAVTARRETARCQRSAFGGPIGRRWGRGWMSVSGVRRVEWDPAWKRTKDSQITVSLQLKAIHHLHEINYSQINCVVSFQAKLPKKKSEYFMSMSIFHQ